MITITRTLSLLRQLRNQISTSQRTPRCARLLLEGLESRLTPTTTAVWTGLGAANATTPNPNWSDAQNWANGMIPTSGDSLSFPAVAAAARVSNNDLTGESFSSISISGTSYQITGYAIDLSCGITDSGTGVDSFALPLTFSAAQSIIDNGTGSNLIIGGAINNNGYLLTVVADGNVQYTGSSITGSGGLTMNGIAKFYLLDSSPNSYTGPPQSTPGRCISPRRRGMRLSAAW